jgi:lipoprotein-releasing system permease protein
MTSVVPFITIRYLLARRRGSGFAPSILSMLGVTVGVMTLTVVLGVMNGFQLGFIESIVEIGSYHLQIHGAAPSSTLPQADIEKLKSLPEITALIPYSERQVLIAGSYSRPRPCLVRAVPSDLLFLDPIQARMLSFQAGSFSIAGADSMVIGSELAALTGAGVGDSIDMETVDTTGGFPAARRVTFTVTGIFKCGYYDYDAGLAFVSFAAASRFSGQGKLSLSYGIKLKDRFMDADTLSRISALLGREGFHVESWRSYNRSFFDALFMEKLMMMVLVGLIFVVVGFNIYSSLRRTVFEKREEIAVLKAVGIPPRSIQYAFIFEGMIIGAVGVTAGLLLGLALVANVNGVFSVVEKGVNFLLRFFQALAAPLRAGGAREGFAIFSPMYFYLTEVPSRVLFPETCFVACFAILASVTAAYGASRTVAVLRPAEILRYE